MIPDAKCKSIKKFLKKGGTINKLQPMPDGDSTHEYVWGTELEMNGNEVESINLNKVMPVKKMDS